ncbi:MAG: hypothetical protein J6K03_09445 [Oscillospiraceae bacterium]|nr:hypothetical protein [Oscillospiraceae bacterium]
MKMLKNMNNVNALMTAVASCTDSVLLKSADGREEYNLKSALSLLIGIGHLCGEHGDEYEIFCTNRADEGFLLNFFRQLKQGDTPAA